MRIGVFGVLALGLLTAACGNTTAQRAASGGLTGAVVGAIVGGPVGALAGAGAGAAGGWAIPEGADTLALNAVGKGRQVAGGALNTVGLGSPGAATSGSSRAKEMAGTSPEVVKAAQARLQRDGLYTGYIDGIPGPKTQEAVRIYQRENNLPQTSQLDEQTLQSLNVSHTAQGNANMPASGTSTAQPPAPAPAANNPPANNPPANGGNASAPGSTSTSTDTGANPATPSPNPSPNR